MASRHGYRKDLGTIALVWLLAGATTVVNAQTQEVHEGTGSAGMTAQEVQKSLAVLSTTIDVRRFQIHMRLKDVLAQVYDQLAEAGIEFVRVVDTQAFKDESPELDIYDVPINLAHPAHLPNRITVREFLREVLNQVPGKNAEVLLRPGFFEITTTKAFEREALSARPPWQPLGWLFNREAPSGPSGIPLSALEGNPIGQGFRGQYFLSLSSL